MSETELNEILAAEHFLDIAESNVLENIHEAKSWCSQNSHSVRRRL